MSEAYIVRRGGSGGKSSGSGGLNFSIEAYEYESALPETAEDNTIAIYPATEISSYSFSATKPENPDPYMVWISTGTSSPAEFNALKENGIQIYPISAKQYVSGNWMDVTAKSYQGGKWVDWWQGELYKEGNEYVEVTGGWMEEGRGLSSGDNKASTAPKITRGAASMTFHNESGGGGVYRTTNKIDLTPYASAILKCDTQSVASSASWCNFYAWKEMPTNYDNDDYWVTKTNIRTNGENLEFTLDVSGCNDPSGYYVGFGLWSATPTLVVKSLVLK